MEWVEWNYQTLLSATNLHGDHRRPSRNACPKILQHDQTAMRGAITKLKSGPMGGLLRDRDRSTS